MSTEAKCPFTHTAVRRQVEPRLVAQSAEPQDPAAGGSDGEGLQLRQGVQEPGPVGGEEGSRGGDDRLAGLVAGGLWPLRPPVHSHGVARRRHVPHPRRPRRRRVGPAAVPAPQRLARQREPRQGAPALVADQAEVRSEDFVGRPLDPGGQRRAGVDGVQDLRVRRRASGRLGTGGGLLGLGGQVAGGQAVLRRAGSRESARRRSDGADLRQPARPERQSGPDRGSHGYPRDVQAHGDERRGDGGAHRGWSHVRQDARRRPGVPCRAGLRSGRHRRAGLRLAEHVRHGQRR